MVGNKWTGATGSLCALATDVLESVRATQCKEWRVLRRDLQREITQTQTRVSPEDEHGSRVAGGHGNCELFTLTSVAETRRRSNETPCPKYSVAGAPLVLRRTSICVKYKPVC